MPTATKGSENRSSEKKIEALREKIRHHEYRYYVLDDPEISDAAIRPAHDRAEEARGSRTSRTDHARLSHPARRRQAARRLSQSAALLAHALAGQHLQRRRAAQLGTPGARTQRARRHRLCLRTEARRHVAGPALRRWQTGARHHPRRRHHGRRRHPERAHGALDPAFHSAGQVEESRHSRRFRSPRRNAHADCRLQENERTSARKRVCPSSPTRATPPPARCANSSPASPRSAGSIISATRCLQNGRTLLRPSLGNSERAGRRRLQGQPQPASWPRAFDQIWTFIDTGRTQARKPSLRNRRHRHQGGSHRAAAELGYTGKAPRWAIAYKYAARVLASPRSKTSWCKSDAPENSRRLRH